MELPQPPKQYSCEFVGSSGSRAKYYVDRPKWRVEYRSAAGYRCVAIFRPDKGVCWFLFGKNEWVSEHKCATNLHSAHNDWVKAGREIVQDAECIQFVRKSEKGTDVCSVDVKTNMVVLRIEFDSADEKVGTVCLENFELEKPDSRLFEPPAGLPIRTL